MRYREREGKIDPDLIGRNISTAAFIALIKNVLGPTEDCTNATLTVNRC